MILHKDADAKYVHTPRTNCRLTSSGLRDVHFDACRMSQQDPHRHRSSNTAGGAWNRMIRKIHSSDFLYDLEMLTITMTNGTLVVLFFVNS